MPSPNSAAGARLLAGAGRAWTALVARGSLVQDIAVAACGNGAILLSAMLAYALAARRFSEAELGQYLLVRRVIQSLMPVVMLGLPVALSRQIALTGAANPGTVAAAVVISSSGVLLSLGLLFLLAALLPQSAAALIIGDAGETVLLQPLLLWLAATCWLQQLYAMYMGRLQTRIANMIQAGGALAALLPFFLLAGGGFAQVLSASARYSVVICVLCTVAPAMWLVSQRAAITLGTLPARALAGRLFAFGLSRVPGFLAIAALWTFIPLTLTRLGETTAATYVLAGIQILLLTAVALQPVSSVLFPRVAERQGAGDQTGLNRSMSLVHRMLLDVWIVVLLQVPVAVPVLLKLWLMLDSPAECGAATVIALAFPAFAAFNVVRNPVDAATPVPYNTYILVAAMAVQAAVYYALLLCGIAPLWAGAVAIAISFTALGAAALAISMRLFPPEPGAPANRTLEPLAVCSVLALLAGLLLKYSLTSQAPALQAAVLMLYEALLALGCLWLLARLRTPWALALREVLGSVAAKLVKRRIP